MEKEPENGVTFPESRRAYERGLREFLSWLPPRPFTRAAVEEYRAHLESSGRAPSTINLRLAPIRKLALVVGHASLQTTERYLGSRQEIATAVNDHLGIPLRGRRRTKSAPAAASTSTAREEHET